MKSPFLSSDSPVRYSALLSTPIWSYPFRSRLKRIMAHEKPFPFHSGSFLYRPILCTAVHSLSPSVHSRPVLSIPFRSCPLQFGFLKTMKTGLKSLSLPIHCCHVALQSDSLRSVPFLFTSLVKPPPTRTAARSVTGRPAYWTTDSHRARESFRLLPW